MTSIYIDFTTSLRLTNAEARVLNVLMEHDAYLLPDWIAERAGCLSGDAVRVHVYRLRCKIDVYTRRQQIAMTCAIETVYTRGYRLTSAARLWLETWTARRAA